MEIEWRSIIEKNKGRLKERAVIRGNIIKYKSRQIHLVNRVVTILHDLNKEVLSFYINNQSAKNEFKGDTVKQSVQLLFKKAISQIESILVLIENGKYLEAYSILRDLFENSVFLLYIVVHPFEADRWFNWAEMNFKTKTEKYRKMEFEEFKSFLEKNNYGELLKLLSKRNFKHYRDFGVWFIREQAFKNHPSMKGSDFKEFYYELCGFVHPSIRALNHNDTLSDIHFNDTVADTLHIAKNLAGIYIDYFEGKFNEFTLAEYENMKHEIDRNTKEYEDQLKTD